jgi:ribonuclease D
MNFDHVTTAEQLHALCWRLRRCHSLALDTEFVSEHTFRPVLCLVQVAADGRQALIDPLSAGDLAPFWELLADPRRETIVHAGRSEIEFCLAATGQPPARVFDVQLAAALVGMEYPASYAALLNKVLGIRAQKHETRTDWRRRPLAERQIEYALDDVAHLHPLYDALTARLQALGRQAWLAEEMADWQAEIVAAAAEERWRRVTGHAALEPRGLAVVRELFAWREREAERRNQPARRVLRDDLIVELARRQTADAKRIGAVRGLERGDLQRRLPEIAACIAQALSLPEAQCPHRLHRARTPELSVLGQFLFAALGSVCRAAELSPSLVGTPNDIREWIAYRERGLRTAEPTSVDVAARADAAAPPAAETPPKLARGWRKQFVGDLLENLLLGRTAVSVAEPESDHPLAFAPRPSK